MENQSKGNTGMVGFYIYETTVDVTHFNAIGAGLSADHGRRKLDQRALPLILCPRDTAAGGMAAISAAPDRISHGQVPNPGEILPIMHW